MFLFLLAMLLGSPVLRLLHGLRNDDRCRNSLLRFNEKVQVGALSILESNDGEVRRNTLGSVVVHRFYLVAARGRISGSVVASRDSLHVAARIHKGTKASQKDEGPSRCQS